MGYKLKKISQGGSVDPPCRRAGRVREKNQKGQRKKEENYIKKGAKGLKNASFWAINFPPPAANLFVGKKMNPKRGGWEQMIKMHNIYPWEDDEGTNLKEIIDYDFVGCNFYLDFWLFGFD